MISYRQQRKKNIPGMLLLVDFEKAFDSISWKFMYKCLISLVLDKLTRHG